MSNTFELNSLFRKQPSNGKCFDLQSGLKECKLQPLFSQERKDYIGRLFHRLNVVNAVNGYRERLHTVFLSLTQPCSDQPILRRFLSALPKAHSENKRCFFYFQKTPTCQLKNSFLKSCHVNGR